MADVPDRQLYDLPPVNFVRHYVFRRHPERHTANEKIVILCAADAMNLRDECWLSVATIAKRTGLSKRTVQRTLKKQKDSPWPLLRIDPRTRACHTFRLVRSPEQFASDRDAARAAYVERARERLRADDTNAAINDIAKKCFLDGSISEEEMYRRVAAIRKDALAGVPADAVEPASVIGKFPRR